MATQEDTAKEQRKAKIERWILENENFLPKSPGRYEIGWKGFSDWMEAQATKQGLSKNEGEAA